MHFKLSRFLNINTLVILIKYGSLYVIGSYFIGVTIFFTQKHVSEIEL